MDAVILAIKSNDFALVKNLIDADITLLNTKSQSTQNSLLHEVVLAYRDLETTRQRLHNLKIGQYIIAQGCAINSTNIDNFTPIHYACLLGISPWIYILSYYSGTFPTRLKTVVNAMRNDSWRVTSYSKLQCKISEVFYDESDLVYMMKCMKFIRAGQFKLFACSHPEIIKEFLKTCDFLNSVLKIVVYQLDLEGPKQDSFNQISCSNIYEIFKFLMKTPQFIDLMIQKANTANESTVYYLIYFFEIMQKPYSEMTRFISTLLNHGLNVTSEDFEITFQCFGCCDVFKQILHSRDIIVRHELESIMVYLYLTVNCDFEQFYNENIEDVLLLDSKWLSSYFAGNKVRRVTQNQNISAIPSLLELSRNATRRFLVSKYKIYDLTELYEVISKIPISETYKEIICYERKLYCV